MLTPIVKAFQIEDSTFQVGPIMNPQSEMFDLKYSLEMLLLTFSSIAS
jgi:hypothetical protein